jgi:hypothetical protein
VAVALLLGVRPETINKRIRDIRSVLEQAGQTINPAEHRISHLDDLYDLARTAGITIPESLTPASRNSPEH